MNLRHIAIAVTCTLALGLDAGAGTHGFKLDESTVTSGAEVLIVFDDLLPFVAGEWYWITITRTDAADSMYGERKDVDSGASEVSLSAPRRPGEYEVRLHDGYPRLSHHVVHRQRLVVSRKRLTLGNAKPTKQASSPPADAKQMEITTTEPALSETKQTSTFEGPVRTLLRGHPGSVVRDDQVVQGTELRVVSERLRRFLVLLRERR